MGAMNDLETGMRCVYTTTNCFVIQCPMEKSADSNTRGHLRETATCTFRVMDLTQHAHQVSVHSENMEKLGETRLLHRHQALVRYFKRAFSATFSKTREKVGETH